MYEVKDEAHAQAFKDKVSLKAERSRPLEERLAAGVKVRGRADSFFMDEGAVRGHGGSRQVSFIPRGGAGGSGGRGWGAREGKAGSRDGSRDFKKRGVQSLGLKSDRPGFRGRGGRGGRGRGRS